MLPWRKARSISLRRLIGRMHDSQQKAVSMRVVLLYAAFVVLWLLVTHGTGRHVGL